MSGNLNTDPEAGPTVIDLLMVRQHPDVIDVVDVMARLCTDGSHINPKVAMAALAEDSEAWDLAMSEIRRT